MTLRAQLTTAALLGTAQQPFEPEPTGSPIDELLSQLKSAEPGQRFLDSAAAIMLYERAGALPLQAPREPALADDDPRPRCTPMAASHLTAVLAERRVLLPEWLTLAEKAGLRPPEELLPAVLNAATSDRSLRDAVTQACGPVGVWLAQFRDEWSWVTSPVADESIWETGSTEERLALLAHLRVTTPGRSRELLQASWPSESAENKRRFLEALTAGRSLDDEPFLESVLDERSVVVRRAAAEHLASLAESRLIERMKDRLAGRVRTSRAGLLGRKTALDIEPLETLDAAMLRDAIDKKPPSGSPLGERAWWTTQAVAAIPPTFWCEQFHLDAGELIEAAKNGQWQQLLMEGWRRAAIRHRTPAWLDAFAAGEMEPGEATTALLLAMPNAARERTMIRFLRQSPKVWFGVLAVCCPHDWSVAFTEEFVEIADRSGQDYYYAVAAMRTVSRMASPQARWPEESGLFAEFTDVVGFRRRMRSAFTSPRN